MQGARMFTYMGKRVKTINLIVGCLHECVYCYAKTWAKRQKHRCQKCYLFTPHMHVERLERKPPRNTPVFINDMSDWMGTWNDENWIKATLKYISLHSDVEFYTLTKNPWRIRKYMSQLPRNMVFGVTIESDQLIYKVNNTFRFYIEFSKAPNPKTRLLELLTLDHLERIFISIEPILDFTEDFTALIKAVNPEFIYIGYCNPETLAKKLRLPEPPLEKTIKLIEDLEKHTEVRVKTLRKAWWEEGDPHE